MKALCLVVLVMVAAGCSQVQRLREEASGDRFINVWEAEGGSDMPTAFMVGDWTKSVLLAKHTRTRRGALYFEPVKLYHGKMPERPLRAWHWDWLRTIRPGATCVMYYSNDPHVDTILEIRGDAFRCGDYAAFRGSLVQFEAKLNEAIARYKKAEQAPTE